MLICICEALPKIVFEEYLKCLKVDISEVLVVRSVSLSEPFLTAESEVLNEETDGFCGSHLQLAHSWDTNTGERTRQKCKLWASDVLEPNCMTFCRMNSEG